MKVRAHKIDSSMMLEIYPHRLPIFIHFQITLRHITFLPKSLMQLQMIYVLKIQKFNEL